MEISLASLREGERGVVTELCMPAERARRLLRLGLIPGTAITLLHRSPLGDPAAFRFRSTTAALRKADARQILISRKQEGQEEDRWSTG